MTLQEQIAAASLAQKAIKAKGYGEAEILALAAQSLDPSIKAEELLSQWREQWLDQNKNRNGESSQ